MRYADVATSRRKHVVKHELIGLEVEVLEATDLTHRGRKGRVVDETKNTLVIEVSGRELRIPKRGSKLLFKVDGDVLIEGDRLMYRPEDRVKKAR